MKIWFFNVPSDFEWNEQLSNEVIESVKVVYGLVPEIEVVPINEVSSKIHVLILGIPDNFLGIERRNIASIMARFLQKYGIDKGSDFSFPGKENYDFFMIGEFY
jgi:hypothetical protein